MNYKKFDNFLMKIEIWFRMIFLEGCQGRLDASHRFFTWLGLDEIASRFFILLNILIRLDEIEWQLSNVKPNSVYKGLLATYDSDLVRIRLSLLSAERFDLLAMWDKYKFWWMFNKD